MKKSLIAGALPLFFLLTACQSGNVDANGTTPPTPQAQQQPPLDDGLTVGTKIQDAPAYSYAYLISETSPDAFDAKTKAAIAGYQVQTTANVDGGKQILLKATDPKYKDQTFTLQPNQKLYFMEKYLQDDQNDTEANEKDDWGVVTEADGTIVSSSK